MHGLRRPSYDFLRIHPDPYHKRHSMQTIRELSSNNLKQDYLDASAIDHQNYQSRNRRSKGSVVAYLTSRFSKVPDSYYFSHKYQNKFDWVIYAGVSLAVVVLMLSLAMLYVISNQKFKIPQHSWR
ncbi:unnamed protein product [Gordionus sp. m RMFG-2023]